MKKLQSIQIKTAAHKEFYRELLDMKNHMRPKGMHRVHKKHVENEFLGCEDTKAHGE